jgi:hypothetical protein
MKIKWLVNLFTASKNRFLAPLEDRRSYTSSEVGDFSVNDTITSAIKYSHIGDFVIYGMHGKD